MPIELRTGLPGAGKTLGAVEHLMHLRKVSPERPVYVLGINDLRDGLSIPLTEDQLRDWQQLPAGAIVMVDEVQKYMPARRGAVDSPQWIRDLSTHRHLGLDFVLITQHPSLIDPYVRKLVDRHIHTVRKYGTHYVERWTWPICMADPNSISAKRQSEQKTVHRYSKEAMAAYKSAEIHTVKRTVPKFLKIAPVVLVAVPLLAWMGVKAMHYAQGKSAGQSASSSTVGPSTPSGGGLGGPKHVLTRDEWVQQREPRVAGIPWSAPMWDGLAVTTVPDLRCVMIERDDGARDCRCYSEQGTRIDVEGATCYRAATDGVYNPYRASSADPRGQSAAQGRKPVDPAQQGQAVPGVSDPVASDSGYPSGGIPQSYVPPDLLRGPTASAASGGHY